MQLNNLKEYFYQLSELFGMQFDHNWNFFDES